MQDCAVHRSFALHRVFGVPVLLLACAALVAAGTTPTVANPPDKNVVLVAEGLAVPVESVRRVTRCNIGRAREDGRPEAVNSCYLAILADRIVFLRLVDRKQALFRTLLEMHYGDISGVALFDRTPAQIQLFYADDVYGVDVMNGMLFRDGKRLLAVLEDLKAAGIPVREPVEWIPTMTNPGVPFTIPVG